MNLSAFDVIGPLMVGPSSSHTAGAARLGLAARSLLGTAPSHATLILHGSFAATGSGHATDRALTSGILGMAPDDARLPQAPELAAQAGIEIHFVIEDFGPTAHPNSARIELTTTDGQKLVLAGASLGGGIIEVSELDGYATSFRCDLHTMVCYHEDRSGFLARATTVLACADINIASLRTTRHTRGAHALTVIETDGPVPADALSLLNRAHWLSQIRTLAPLP